MRPLLQRALTGAWGEYQGGMVKWIQVVLEIPPQTSPPDSHWKSQKPKPKQNKKSRGHLPLPWKLSEDAAHLSETHGIFVCHWADISDQRGMQDWGILIRQEKHHSPGRQECTEGTFSILSRTPRAVESSHAQPGHIEKKNLGST